MNEKLEQPGEPVDEKSRELTEKIDELNREEEEFIRNIPLEVRGYVRNFSERMSSPDLTFEESQRLAEDMRLKCEADPLYRLAFLVDRFPDSAKRPAGVNIEISQITRGLIDKQRKNQA